MLAILAPRDDTALDNLMKQLGALKASATSFSGLNCTDLPHLIRLRVVPISRLKQICTLIEALGALRDRKNYSMAGESAERRKAMRDEP